jgi:hypothetical protein
MNYEQQFLQDFEDWVNQQVQVMSRAKKIAEEESEQEAALRYESRLDAYQFLQGKFENYKHGKSFYDMPDLGKVNY